MNELEAKADELREILATAEDMLAKAHMCDARISLFNYEHNGKVKQKRVRRKHPITGMPIWMTTPVAALHFDGQTLSLERDGSCLDIFAIDDTFWLCEIASNIPAMHQRLVEDSKVDPAALLAAATACRDFTATLEAR